MSSVEGGARRGSREGGRDGEDNVSRLEEIT